MKLKLISFIIALVIFSAACKRTAGPGGRATIKGKVYAQDFNTANTGTISSYYVAGETVYIIYGNSTAVGNDVKTAPDGSFEFRYLRQGHYQVYVLSKDTSIHQSGSSKENPVTIDVNITSNTQKFDVGTISINK